MLIGAISQKKSAPNVLTFTKVQRKGVKGRKGQGSGVIIPVWTMQNGVKTMAAN